MVNCITSRLRRNFNYAGDICQNYALPEFCIIFLVLPETVAACTVACETYLLAGGPYSPSITCLRLASLSLLFLFGHLVATSLSVCLFLPWSLAQVLLH